MITIYFNYIQKALCIIKYSNQYKLPSLQKQENIIITNFPAINALVTQDY